MSSFSKRVSDAIDDRILELKNELLDLEPELNLTASQRASIIQDVTQSVINSLPYDEEISRLNKQLSFYRKQSQDCCRKRGQEIEELRRLV